MSDLAPICYVVTTLTPPTTGMTVISSKMVAAIQARGQLDLWAVRKPEGCSAKRWFIHKNLVLMLGLLRAAWRAQPIDTIYIVPDANVGLWANLVLHFPLLWLSRARIMFHHHVFRYVRMRDWRLAFICARLAPRLSHLLLSESMRHRFSDHYRGQTNTLSNAVFLELPDKIPKAPTSCRNLGFLSNITEDKGILDFMETSIQAQFHCPGLKVHIAGGIKDSVLKAKVREFIAADPDARKWYGPVYGADKERFFAEIDLLIFPTKYANEAQPVTIFEALARHRPVLATNQGCISDQLPTGACLAHENFPAQAATLIASWQDEAVFAQVVATHSASWSASLSESQGQFDTVMKTLTPSHVAP